MSVGSTLVMLGREYVCLGQFALINARISKDKSSFSVNKKAALEWVFFRNGDGKFLFTNKFDKNCKVIPPTKETIALAKEVLELADDKERFATMWTSKVAKRPWSSSSRNTCDLNLIPDRLLELTKFSTRKSSTKEFTDEVRHAIYDFVETFYDEVIHVKQVSLSEKSQPFTEIYNAKSISKRTLDSNFRDPGMADKFRNMISA